MQERLVALMQQGQQPAKPAPMTHDQRVATAAPPLAKPPSLMDHLIALRQETAAMRQEVSDMRNEMVQLAQVVQANSNVVEGVGQAVGHIYQMFQQTSDPSPTYSQGFQQAQPGVEDADY